MLTIYFVRLEAVPAMNFSYDNLYKKSHIKHYGYMILFHVPNFYMYMYIIYSSYHNINFGSPRIGNH